ncbi:MAG: hypothetical protein RLZZ380_839 [Actinomycetota bacterium]
MFKKIAAIVATAAMLVVGFSAMPASATTVSNPGSNKKTSWSLGYSSPEGVLSPASATAIVPPSTTSLNSYMQIRFGNTAVQQYAGHDIVITWNETFPAGVTWRTSTQYDPTKPYKYISGSGGGGYYPTWSEVNPISDNPDPAGPANSSVFTVPASVSQINQTYQYFAMTLGLSLDNSNITAGNYTIAPTLYDKTAGAPITLSSTEGDNEVYATSSWFTSSGQGAFTGTIPAKTTMTQSINTCVLASSLVEGHAITIDRFVDGTSVGQNQYGNSFQIMGTQTYGGNFSPNWTVTSDVVTNSWKGIRIGSQIEIDNSASATTRTVPNLDLIVTDIDAANAQIEASCAPAAPAKPTFTLGGTTYGTLTWAKHPSDTNVQYWNRKMTYNWSLFKQSDLNTPVMTRSVENPTLTNGTYSESISFRDSSWNPLPVDLDTNYVIKMTATAEGDYVESEYSVASEPSALIAPTAPTGVALDLVSQTSFKITWNKIAADVERTDCGQPNCGRSASYTYQLYKASDLNTVVAQGGMMGATLTGNSYSVTLSNVMSGPPMWNTVRLLGSTDYVVKVKAYDSLSGLDSPYSQASAADSLVGPAAPNTPTEPMATVNSVSAKLTVRAGETANMHKLVVFAQSDTTFSNPLTTSMNSYSSCMATTPGALTYTCTVTINSGMATFNAPNMYVVRAYASNSDGLDGSMSPASTAFIGGIPGVTITAPSNGTTAGDAKTITSTFPGITDTYGSTNGMYVMPKGSFISDGVGNVYTIADAGVDGSVGRSFDLKKVKSDFTGFDSTFGTSGKVSTTIAYGNNNTTVNLPTVWTFAKGTKMAMSSWVSNCAPGGSCMTDSTYTFREATAGQAFGTPVNMAGKALSFCTSNATAEFGTPDSANFSSMSGFQGLSRPVALVTCNKTDQTNFTTIYERYAATIGTDGSFTKLFMLHTTNATQNNYSRYTTSFNPSATAASDVAAVMYLVRYKNVNGISSNYERVIVRVKVDGSVTETPAGLTVSGSEPTVTLAPVNDGTTVYAIINASNQNKFSSTPVAAGGLEAGTLIAVDNVSMMASVGLTFPSTGAPVVGGKVAFIRSDRLMSGTILAPMSYNVATGAVVTGEALTYSASGSPVSYSVIDAAGHMNFIYTPSVTQQTLAHSVIQWKNVRDMVAVPTPAVTMPEAYFSLNAGGTSITIEGVNLNETSAAKKVTGIKFGMGVGTAGLVTSVTKTATSITVKIPTSIVAGATTVPTAALPFSVPVTVVLGGGGTLMAGSVTYVGTAKLVQPVTLNVVTTPATTATPDRVVSAIVGAISPMEAAVLMPAVVSSTTPTVCSIVDGKVHFISNGNCIVKAIKAGNAWLAEGSATSVAIPVLKADSVTAGFTPGETPNEGMSEDDAIAPVVTLASGRKDFTMTSADSAKCSINPDTKMIWFKAGNQNCVITIATAAANAQWAAVSYTWTIAMQPPAGGAGSPLLVRNDNVMVKLPGLALKWNQKTNQVYFVTRVKWIGPVQAKMTFTDLDGALQSCVVNFGTLKKTPLPANGDPFILTSPALCTDTKSALNKTNTAAEKAAQAAVYAKFKALVAAKTAAGESTSVEFTYRRELHRATDYALRTPGETLLTKEWSTPTYASLYYKAIDTITASLPVGVPAAASATADGAFVPVITLESKRTDYTVTSSDETKCVALADGRIWAKVAGENCVLTIGTGTNAIWAGKSFTWTIPMVAAVAADAGSAVIAPSNNTATNIGPIAVTWNQATSAVAMKLTNRNVGLVTAKMTFTGLDNVAYSCEVKFGSAAKVAAALVPNFKTQTSGAFCTYTTGLTSAQKATQAAALVKFKALVAARKAGVGVGVIPITLAFKFEAHNPLNGALVEGQTLNSDVNKPWSPNVHVKLNYRATSN